MMFTDRRDAGRQLATLLARLGGLSDAVVVGLPRGGVPVAAEIASALHAPLDVIVVRKLGVPFQPEFAMGAIGEDDVRVVDPEVIRLGHVTAEEVASVEARERHELERRVARFRRARPRVPLAGRVVVVVDDGIATGSTARAACAVARAEGATRIVLAVPVAPADWRARLAGVADDLVALHEPVDFAAVGQFYRDFSQTSDDEVVRLLAEAERAPATPVSTGDDPSAATVADVAIPVGTAVLQGQLVVPGRPQGLVIFAHGSGSSRHSPRNRYVASRLSDAGLATLLFDLLTVDEESSRSNVFDIELLAERLNAVARWAADHPALQRLAVGYFGASTGAAAALWAAGEPTAGVGAVVSRGGRPDLAEARLHGVRAPTRLIVGGEDTVVLELNRRAEQQLRCESDLAIVPGATHLFEEPGALHRAAELACEWFLQHLADGQPPPRSRPGR